MEFPQLFRVHQHFDAPSISDIDGEIHDQLTKLALGEKISPGETVAITAGSRGISNIAQIIKAVVMHFQQLGAKPFIVPSMGSHGGGTAEGQRAIIEGYGMTEEFLGCPIRSSMETVLVCESPEGVPIHFDQNAYQADHVFVCGRVKPHTRFSGEIESGLLKMMLIGLGKRTGARIYHRAIQDFSFDQILHSVIGEVLQKCSIVAGLGIVENGYEQTAMLEAIHPQDFIEREKVLLKQAKDWFPKVPFEKVDLLLIDQIGKNISGSGMDTNVVGRKVYDHCAAEHEFPKVKRIALRGLTEATHGNACGFGIAEFATQAALDSVDWEITKVNALTGGHPTVAMSPVIFPTDQTMLENALTSIGLTEPPDARMVWIQDTLHLAEFECSTAFLKEVQANPALEILREPLPLGFDEHGKILERYEHHS
ncbi:Iron-sulfur cluster binding protein [Planctomycetales bacterium 10988]|nr:Iron-sulfur cluster binding protein [Planctomycetales bacterium 10988]